MKQVFKIIIPASIIVLAIVCVVLNFHTSFAADSSIQSGVNAAHGAGQPSNLFGNGGIFTTISNVLLFIVGTLSVIMLIIGGLRYVVSGGNSTAITGAKNTVLYAIVGLVVALLAYAVINFVLTSLTGGGLGGGTNV